MNCQAKTSTKTANRRLTDKQPSSRVAKPITLHRTRACENAKQNQVERRRVELPASSLRTNVLPDQSPTKQGDSATQSESSHDCSVTPSEATPSVLTRLLMELAALPPEQRAALAALLAPQPAATPVPPAALNAEPLSATRGQTDAK